MMRLFLGAVLALLFCASPGAIAQPQQQPASVAQLMSGVNLSYTRFTLPNGLTVLVHEDHKAPIVSVAAWYNVGSKDEPQGQTGFAHLYEHIMILNGTEHVPNLVEPLREMGASNWNGSTWFDRTNYFQVVPKPAIERTLYLESERMGYLLGALTQTTLDRQRGVVQNEKRQGDNQPYGLTQYRILENLFPEGHPYRHSTIGSMADLDAASLDTVRGWFRENYGPNNCVLVLAGDITVREARTMVARYFGAIPRGTANVQAPADVPTLAARINDTTQDRVANTRLYRVWAVPGIAHADTPELTLGASVLGGLGSSRLDRILVRQEQTAVNVSSFVQPFQRISMFYVTVDVKPGQDAGAVSQRLDAIISDFIANGPTADELQRAVTTAVSGSIFTLEQVGGGSGQAGALGNSAILAGDPDFYVNNLRALGAVTPAGVKEAMAHWLTRPVYALRVDPGARPAYQEASATTHPAPDTSPATATPRDPMPAVGQIADLDFPTVEHARLSNGIEIAYAQRTAIPATFVTLDFNAGVAADPQDHFGAQRLMLSLLTAGAGGRDETQIAEQEERLGANIAAFGSLDRSTVNLTALSPNLGLSLDLFADVVMRPDFADSEVSRLRNTQLAAVAQEATNPNGLAQRALPPILYGANHPYGRAGSGIGTAASVATLDRAAIVDFHKRWIRPETAQMFVVSDRPLREIQPLLEARFGSWHGDTATPVGRKDFSVAIPAPRPRIVLVDRPQSPQSIIYAGAVLPITGNDDVLTLNAANEVLGNNFLSRINQEIRERRGWSYGLGGQVALREQRTPYIINAPVQADRTGDSIKVLMEQINAFRTTAGVTEAEHTRTINGSIRQLPGVYETGASVLGALRTNALYHRPDNYWDNVAGRYRAMSAAQMDQAARAVIDPAQFVWVVVGDASVVRPQLEQLGLPVEVVTP